MNQVEIWIEDYVKTYKTLKETSSEWRPPVIGTADAKDPRFEELKILVGPSHFLPSDLLSDAKSVVVFFLPFDEAIVKSNIGEIESSKAWDIANIETNNLILDINHHVNALMKIEGYESTIMPATYNYDEKLLKSDWSHRHVGHIAGIGTFGIHGLLITDKGCCGRMGSIITNMPLKESMDIGYERCLYKYNGSCGACINKCVVDAIENSNVNRRKCNDQIYDDNIPVYDIGIGDACGKCMCGVPCSLISPVKPSSELI
ncbi:epoxyqueuosine reductase [Acidaminobacter sp. JC074]|uniref:epoxyqueuosine reductase n=1 Tax=Acidaminobacter sp. JC074 TaxID=2530199 RepID=UPI001F0F4C63|nr:epoxyqueuosine reductase [Acidaminobacter sp. JC074]MCH4890861.1 epoxyqueuosine reductase [Acidaminobacter sp. JC074]